VLDRKFKETKPRLLSFRRNLFNKQYFTAYLARSILTDILIASAVFDQTILENGKKKLRTTTESKEF